MRLRTGYASVLGLIGLFVLFASVTPASAAGTEAPPSAVAPAMAVVALATGGDSLDGQIGGLTRGLVIQLRRYWRITTVIWARATDWWAHWLRRAFLPIGIVLMALLADSGLLNAFRLDGLRALSTYVPLMLYVYGRLFFSGGVKLLPKLLVLGAIVYGAVRRDIVPDRSLVPGRVEDIVLLILATRAFVYACPEALVEEYAERAVTLRLRFQRAQQRAR